MILFSKAVHINCIPIKLGHGTCSVFNGHIYMQLVKCLTKDTHQNQRNDRNESSTS